MSKLIFVIVMALFTGSHITLMVLDPASVYWAHWAVLVGVVITITTNAMTIVDKMSGW